MFDIVIRNGWLIDGSGAEATRADVAVQDGKIAAVGTLPTHEAHLSIDASDQIVCPGFIDMHTHSDLRLIVEPMHEAKVRQGVTLDVVGHDGLGYAPLEPSVFAQLQPLLDVWNGDATAIAQSPLRVAEYLELLDGAAINAAFLAPHGTIRTHVLGLEDRSPTTAELERMQRLLETALEEGAVGLSVGLQYVPSMFASTDELVALCTVVARYGGFFAPHHRSYGADAMEAYDECFEIARRSGVALHLTHAHLSYDVNAGKAADLLRRVDEARSAGLDVTLDSYPYTTGNPKLSMFLPRWLSAGGVDRTIERLADPSVRSRLRAALEEDGFEGVPIAWERLEISSVLGDRNRPLVGRRFSDAAAARQCDPFDLYCDLLIDERLEASCIEHIGNEDNVRTIMQHPAHMLSTDGILVGDRPHPRGWAGFAHFLITYVRDLRLFSWEEAIRKITHAPAQRLGLSDRGLLRAGYAADIVCFNPDTLADTSSFATPRQHPDGIETVIVNGRLALHQGTRSDALAGRAIRRTTHSDVPRPAART